MAAYSDAGEIRPDLIAAVQRALELGLLERYTRAVSSTGKRDKGELALILDRLTHATTGGKRSWGGTLESRTMEQEEIAGRPAESALWIMVRPGAVRRHRLSSDHGASPYPKP